MKPKMIGSINCFVASPFRMNGRTLNFDGTIKGLVNKAREFGAQAGTVLEADFGAGFDKYQIVSAPKDDRCAGLWANKVQK